MIYNVVSGLTVLVSAFVCLAMQGFR